MWDELSDAIRDLLKANSLIQEVFDWEHDTISGDPSVCVFASANGGSYRTTTENDRAYAFTVRCYVARGGSRSQQDAEEVMRQLVDSILDDVDRSYYLQNLGAALPAGYTVLKVDAAVSRWGYVDLAESYRIAEIELVVHTDVDVTVIN